MKYFFLFIFSLSSCIAYTQSLDESITSLEKGTAASLEKYMDANVSIVINGKAESMTKQNAIAKINDFLERVKPTKVDARHKGSSQANKSSYRVAQMITESTNYRVFFYLEIKEDRSYIKEIRIDKE